jgi:hypothetical protein
MENNLNIWNFVKADKFFKTYLPNIKSYKYKILGRNSRGNPCKFSDAEKEQIQNALKLLFKDLERSIE